MDANEPILAPTTAVYRGPAVDARGVLPKKRLPLGSAESLAVLMDEWAFFTPAVLYLHGMFADSYLIDFMYDVQADVPLYFHKFQNPIFTGLHTREGNKDWNCALWAVKREDWEALTDFLCSLSLADRDKQSVHRFGLQELTVLDPLVVDRRALIVHPVPTVTLGAFGMYGSAGRMFFADRTNVFLPPRLVTGQVDEADRVFAEAYFAGGNPLDAREAYVRSQTKDGAK